MKSAATGTWSRKPTQMSGLCSRTDGGSPARARSPVSRTAKATSWMASSEPAGRRMDFLVQEMHREVNTTGSKSQHAEISARVVSMKAEVERIREQVQNVE